jgi:predicted HTH domain antitoxin
MRQPVEADLVETRNAIKEKTKKVLDLKKNNKESKATIDVAIEYFEKTKDILSKMEEKLRLKPVKLEKDGRAIGGGLGESFL